MLSTQHDSPPRLIILSDIFGQENLTWLDSYVNALKSKFEIQFYDCTELARITIASPEEKFIHQQFVYDGMEKAVERLLLSEKSRVYVLGFSIGGTIAWRAGLRGLNILSLTAISSARLRIEHEKPTTNISLYYGENDANKPAEHWFNKLSIRPTILKNKGHSFYRDIAFAKTITDSILRSFPDK